MRPVRQWQGFRTSRPELQNPPEHHQIEGQTGDDDQVIYFFSATRHCSFPPGFSIRECSGYLKQFYRQYDILPQKSRTDVMTGSD